MSNLNFNNSKTQLDTALEQSKVFDLGIPIHRTNSLPLDISAVVYLDNSYESIQDFNEAAKEALKEQNNATWYPGQQIAVLGKVEDTCHAICFILQPDNQEAKELAYKEDVLQRVNESLSTAMRFRGVLESLPSLTGAHDYLPGDMIVIKRATNATDNGTPGMEYICIENSPGSANKYSWIELGFGTNLAQFIGGNAGLTLPSSSLASNPESLIDFIKQADKFLGYKIGILDESGNLKMPEVNAGDQNHLGYSLVNYIDNADTAEKTRALEAEAGLLAKINAIDFVDPNELANAIKDFATDSELSTGLALKADKTDFNNLKSTVDAFFDDNAIIDNTINTLKELINYINTHDDVELADIIADVQILENRLILGTYLDGEDIKEYATVKAYVEAAIAALKIGDYAKAAELTALAKRVAALEQNSATKTELSTKVSNTEFEQFKNDNTAAIEAAKNEAIADARFQEDLTLTYKFGKYEPDDTGSFTLHCAGKTMKEVLLDAFAQEVYEGLILTVPTVSFSLSGTNATNTGEVGTTHGSPAAKLDLNISGSYKYGAKTSTGTLANPDIKATSARILMNDVTKISMDEANPNADLTYTHNLTGNDLIYKDGTDTYTFVAYASHGADDNRPLTNLGNFVSGSPGNYTGTTEFSKAVGHITAKSETEFCNGKTVSASYTGYRKMFMGTVSVDPTAINSDFIRGLSKISKKAVKEAQEFTVEAGQKSFYVAIPTSLTTAVPTFKYKFFGNWEVQNGVVALDNTVDVEGANGYEAKPYKVYVYTPASGSFEANTDIQVTIN